MSNYYALTDPEQIKGYIERCRQATAYGIDTETTGVLRWSDTIVGLCLSAAPGEGVYIPLAHERDTNADANDWLTEIHTLVTTRPGTYHNAAFDLPIIGRWLGIEPHTVLVAHDTMLAAQCLGERAEGGKGSSAGLKALAKKYLGVERGDYTSLFPEKAKKKDRRFAALDVDLALPYAAADAEDTLRLMSALWPVLDAEAVGRVYAMELQLLPEVVWMESRGMLIDVEFAAARDREAHEFATAAETAVFGHLTERLGRPVNFNLNSSDQLAKILFAPPEGLTAEQAAVMFPKKRKDGPEAVPGGLGLPILLTTAGGMPSTNEATLNKLAAQEPFVEWVLEMRGALKAAGTYFATFPEHAQHDHILHPSFNQFGAETGRFSCSAPNVQNIPKGARFELPPELGVAPLGLNAKDMIVPRPGYVLVDADYSQIEYRIIAGCSQDPALLQIFRDGVDLHIGTAAQMLGKRPDEITKQERQDGKQLNYALAFGAGPARVASMLGITPAEAKTKMATYFSAFPHVQEWKKSVEVEAERNRWVATKFGRKRWLNFGGEGIDNDAATKAYHAALREAANVPPQGTAADLMKICLIRVGPWLREHYPEVHTLATTHDSVTFEVPETQDLVEFIDAARTVIAFPEGFLPGFPAIPADFETGTRWGSLIEWETAPAAPVSPAEAAPPQRGRVMLNIADNPADTDLTAALGEMKVIVDSLGPGTWDVDLYIDAMPGEKFTLTGSAFTPEHGHLIAHLFKTYQLKDAAHLEAVAVAS